MTTTDTLIAMIRERHAAGLAKYGVTVDRKDLTPEQWLQHSIEERIDDLKYMMRAAQEIAALRQNRDDWRACAEVLKAALELENCPEGGEAFGDVVKSARGLFDSLTGEPVNVEGEMP